MEGKAYIRTENLRKVYNPGKPDEMTALHDISVQIDRGGMTVLKGPSGSGKTSLLSAIGCMSRPTEGRVLIDGKDVVKLPERFLTDMRRKKFGFIFQQFHLIRNLSVLENILLPLYPTDMMPAEMKKRAPAILTKAVHCRQRKAAGKKSFRRRAAESRNRSCPHQRPGTLS